MSCRKLRMSNRDVYPLSTIRKENWKGSGKKSIKLRLNSSNIASDALWQVDLSITTLWKWYASASRRDLSFRVLFMLMPQLAFPFLAQKHKNHKQRERKNESRDFEVDDGPLWIKKYRKIHSKFSLCNHFKFNSIIYFISCIS
jgi:hypothetical protein